MARNKHNTHAIIKYLFWQMTYQNPEAFYACVNYGEAYAPKEIMERSICIDGDIGNVLFNTSLSGVGIPLAPF